MAAPFDEDPLFTTLLQSGGHREGSTPFDCIDDNVLVQASHCIGERMPPSKKSFRVSLTNRWQCIQKFTNKFCAAVAQVESIHPNGATEQDKLEKAKILYKENENAKYTMEHCWCLLRHQPKWQQHMSMLHTRRRLLGKRPTIADSTPLANDTLDDNVDIIGERPLGKKSKKERERKKISREDEDVEFNKALSRMTDDRTVCMVERRKAVTKAESDRMSLTALKKKVDIEIMKLDLARMNALQQGYFQTLQKEFYEEMKNRSTSTSTSSSISFGGK